MKTSPVSAGLLMFRREPELQVFIAHPGGPFWQNRDEGAWTIPKGLINPDEQALDGAIREFFEETSLTPTGPYLPLGWIKQKAGKTVHAWAFEGDADPAQVRSNETEVEWPMRSGKRITVPEIDRCAWFTTEQAREKLNVAQAEFLDRLVAAI